MLTPVLEFSATIADELPPFQYARGLYHWQIELDREGVFQALTPLTRQGKKGKLDLGSPDCAPSPYKERHGNDPKLVIDTAEYILGLEAKRNKDRAVAYHQAYLELLEQCYQATQEASLRAIAQFLHNDPLAVVQADLERYPVSWPIEAAHVIRFLVDGVDPTQLPSLQQFWAERCTRDDLPEQPCLVTGEVQTIATKLEHKLKSIPNTQGSGASLISAYRASFHSYGRAGAEASPIGIKTAESLGQTLSYLESQPKHRCRVGPIVYLYWSIESDFSPMSFLDEPSPEDVRVLLEALQSGKYAPDVDPEVFYILALSGSGGRAVVRDFLQTTVGQVKAALARWFDAQSLISFDGNTRDPVGLYALAAQAYRDPAKELQARTLTAMSRSALIGVPLPRELLHKVLERARVTQGLIYRQASLIKLILNYLEVNIPMELDERMESLQTDRERAAYCCGRLLATFGSIQYSALGDVNATVIDKSYGAASTTPSKVFGQLEAKTQAHLAELRRKKKEKLANFFTTQLQSLHASMPGASFPVSLTLEEQGIFAMGYWHQQAARSAKSRETNKTPDSESENNSEQQP